MNEIDFLKEKIKLLEKIIKRYRERDLYKKSTENYARCTNIIDYLNDEIANLMGG